MRENLWIMEATAGFVLVGFEHNDDRASIGYLLYVGMLLCFLTWD